MSDRFWDALEARQAALAFVSGPRWDWYTDNLEGELVEGDGAQWLKVNDPNAALKRFRVACGSSLIHGPTFWWSPEMCDALKVLKETVPDAPLDSTELITSSGFFYYDTPIRLGGSDKHIVATSWIVMAEDNEEPRFSYAYRGEETGVVVMHYSRPPAGYIVPVTMSPWSQGTSIREHYERSIEMQGVETHASIEQGIYTGTELLKLFMAAQLFVQQKVASSTNTATPRDTRRRVEKEKHRVEDTNVQVVRLRRRENQTDYASDGVKRSVDWDHRWWVGLSTAGFWRNQPTKDGYKRILIAPYVKGPEDKPLVTPDRIMNVVTR